MPDLISININYLYSDKAKLSELNLYINKAVSLAGDGKKVILTGEGPIWLYLSVAHALHGKAKKMIYRSPVAGDVVIFDHDPF